jgi:hypothetical protein
MTLSSRTFRQSALIAYALLCLLSPPAHSDEYVCARPPITIHAGEPEDYRSVCGGVQDALAFFGRLDLDLSRPLSIAVLSDLRDENGETLVGCYKDEDRTVNILTFAALQDRGVWFGVPVNRHLYRSLATHEVAHAVAACNFGIPHPTLHAHEYIAYVAMLATMNPATRAEVLATRPGSGYEELSEINELTHAFDPTWFGIEAYRHYLKDENGDAFLLKVLAGEVLTNTIHDLP